MTYMNLSGPVGLPPRRVFAIPPGEILVVHDELDLLPGEAKMKFGGGVAGHNGLKDIAAQFGTQDFWRLRIGIGHPRDSSIPQQDVADYVLAPPCARPTASSSPARSTGRSMRGRRSKPASSSARCLLLHTKERN